MSSSKLKRKLNDLGVNVSSSKANESFCLIGTPLPPLEKSKDLNEFVPLWKQEVRDEKGRRRLHGAFTGGFSAGYFNTVGSKEGWSPSTFVSSRKDRAKAKASRPEDFMDEEDLQELQDSKKLVDSVEEMDLTGGTEAELARRAGAGEDTEKDSLATALEASMLPAPKDSAGARILKKMGWKIGQGVGPRVTYLQRKLQDLQLSGNAVTETDLKLTPEEEEANKHLYPPRDSPVLKVERKENAHGLGYTPGLDLHASLGYGNKSSTSTDSRISAGFGLGALNEAEDDDLDVYDSGVDRGKRQTAYDLHHADEEERVPGRKSAASRFPTGGTTFRDGTPVLPGFTLSGKPVAEDRWFPLPELPRNWSPDPKRLWEQDLLNNEAKPVATSPLQGHGKWRTGITADQRGHMLGETPLPATPHSVFEYMSQKDRERLQNISANIPPGALPSTGPSKIHIPHTEPHIANAALGGFQPFTSDPTKQVRYTAYLQSQAVPQDQSLVETLRPLPEQNIDEFNKELEDYAKAALIFKPISGAMAGRFMSASVVEMGPTIVEGLYKPVFQDEQIKPNDQGDDDAKNEEQERERRAKETEEADRLANPKVHAAKMGMYGPLTREMKSWQPAKLLCKRFGVKDPTPHPELFDSAGNKGNNMPGEPEGQSQKEKDFFDAVGVPGVVPRKSGQTADKGGQNASPKDVNNVGLGEDEGQGRDTLTYQRPAMDVFKAIFASDDEDSEDEKGGDGDEGDADIAIASIIQAPTPGLSAPTINNTKPDPGRGSNAAGTTIEEKMDLSTFKPTFIPRTKDKSEVKAASDGKGESKEGDKEKEKTDKKRKKKEKKSGLVSFASELDDDGVNGRVEEDERPKKRRKDKDKKRKEKDEGLEEDGDKRRRDRSRERRGKEKGDRKHREMNKERDDSIERQRKRRRSKERDDDREMSGQDDDSMWVEKEVPSVARELAAPLQPSFLPPETADSNLTGVVKEMGPPRGRKRAVDFL